MNAADGNTRAPPYVPEIENGWYYALKLCLSQWPRDFMCTLARVSHLSWGWHRMKSEVEGPDMLLADVFVGIDRTCRNKSIASARISTVV